jgi:hypothetical protein
MGHAYFMLGDGKARRYVDELLRLIPRYTLTALRKHPML